MFYLTDGAKIGMNMYSTIMPARRPYPKNINSKTQKLLKKNVRLICDESGTSLYRNQIGNFYPLGNEKIRIDFQEYWKIKNFEIKGMKLLGFKPRKYL